VFNVNPLAVVTETAIAQEPTQRVSCNVGKPEQVTISNGGHRGSRKFTLPQGKSHSTEEKAYILAESTIFGKSEAARRNGIGPKTIYNWEQKLQENGELAEKYREKCAYMQFRWYHRLPGLMEKTVDAIEDCLAKAESDSRKMESAVKVLELASQMQLSIASKKQELREAGVYLDSGT